MGDLVVVRDVTKVYEPLPRWMRLLTRTPTRTRVTALDGVSFSVPSGTIVAIVGPNGAGKSTLFRVMTGLTTATSGTATVDGIEAGSQGPALRRVVGFMPADDRALHLRLTCTENLAFHGRLHAITGAELSARIADVLDQVGLGHKADAVGFALSSGMRARLLLARALLHRPKLLILDEPTGEADPVAAYELLEVVKRAASDLGTGVLISSHRLEEIEALGERVLLMHEGTIAYDGDLATLRRTWDRPVIQIEFTSAAVARSAAQALATTEGVHAERPDGRLLSVTTERGTGAVLAALNGHIAKIRTVNETHVPLRDVLAQMARGGKGTR